MSEKNVSALDDLLAKAKNDSSRKKPLWRVLIDRLDSIEEAKAAGLTYKEMAAELNVSATNFNISLKKALSHRDIREVDRIVEVTEADKSPSSIPPVKSIVSKKPFETTNL